MLAATAAQNALAQLEYDDSPWTIELIVSGIAHALAEDQTGISRQFVRMVETAPSNQVLPRERQRRRAYLDAFDAAYSPLTHIERDLPALRRFLAVIADGGQPLAAAS
jgi:hypothetical protein